MKRRNNKGFSLIELIIAVAVMALLITPIIVQLAHTLDTSAQAKEKQYADENAEYVMEYFRKTEKSVLDKGGSVDGQVTIESLTPKKNLECEIYVSGTSDSVTSIYYDVTDYNLDSVQLGRKNNTYTRKVSMDDLANKIMEKGFRIDYDFDGDLEEGFSKQNDGSAVKYDDDGHVVGVYCKSSTGSYTNPNNVNLGNIQNLDSSTMAIVEGDASTLDTQFEADVVAFVTDASAEADATSVKQVNDNITAFDQTVNVQRAIIINTSGIVEDSKVTGYNVNVDVLYNPTGTFLGKTMPAKRYTIFNQNFSTDEAPDVYFIYEPYVKSKSTMSEAAYSANDYIFVSADKYTNGEDGNDPAKIYLVRPENTWFSINKAALLAAGNIDAQKASLLGSDLFTYVSGGSPWPVQIHVNQIKSGEETTPIKIYTNVSMTKNLLGEWIIRSIGNDNQFDVVDQSSTGVGTTALSYYPAGSTFLGYGYDLEENKFTNILPIYDDPNYAERLYSITVTLTDPKGSTTHYKGTKGAE